MSALRTGLSSVVPTFCCPTPYEFPGDDIPIVKGSALVALEYVQNGGTDVKNAKETACIMELMNQVDAYIPAPERATDLPFLMPVEDVFTITGRGTVATGRVERGVLRMGDKVEIVGLSDEKRETTVTGIEMFRKLLDYAEGGDNIGALLRGVQRTDIERGQVLAKPGSIHPHTHFTSQVYVLTKEEGGRTTAIEEEFSPQFYYANDVTGVITGLTDGTMNPGETQENITVKFTSHKGVWYVGQTLEVRQAGRKLGTFTVTKIGSSPSRPTGSRPSTTTRPTTKQDYAENRRRLQGVQRRKRSDSRTESQVLFS